MNILNIIDFNHSISKDYQFNEGQWKMLIDYAFQRDKQFSSHAKSFYIEYLGFEDEECNDLITDIENGDGDAFERFMDDIIYYCNN